MSSSTCLLLDFDDPRLDRVAAGERIEMVCRTVGLDVYNYEFTQTARGWHGMVLLCEKVAPAVEVALQAIMGSDWKRETFNLQRALVLAGAPDFWRERWNVLYANKLEAK
jgi:hypothetical protein